MYSLTVTQLALSVISVNEVRLDRHNLGFEEVAHLASELGPSLHKVERLGKIGWDLERERNVRFPHVANVIGKDGDHLCFLPDTTLPYVRISLAFVAVVDLLTHINQLELQLNAICGNGLVSVDVDRANDRMVGIEGARVALEYYGHGRSVQLGFSCSHLVGSGISF